MATRFEFVLFGGDEPMLRDAGEAAINDVLDAHNRLTRFERTSIVSAINAHAGHRPVRIDDELFGLLTIAERIRIESDNAFDITLGSSELILDSAKRTVMLPDPSGIIDLGGIGKGHALDLATETLRDAGVESGLLHGGTSTFAAIGHRPGGEPWTVSIAEALDATLANDSLSVSNAVDGSSAHREHIVGATS
ncbi:MAG: FAD:protein FMN transferase, partial [Planctomycetota bacterium]